MEVWSRFTSSFSSLPTTSSSSPPSSSASLDACPVVDIADKLWFYSCVVALPSLPVPSLPSIFTPSPDASTLIAQCMITDFSRSSQRSVNSSVNSSSPPLLPRVTSYDALPAPPSSWEESYPSIFPAYDEISNGGNLASIACDRDGDMHWGYASDRDEDIYRDHVCSNTVGEDEEAYYYYTAPSDWDDDEAHHSYHGLSDCEDEEEVAIKIDVVVPPAVAPQRHLHDVPGDVLWGIGALAKDQSQRRTGTVSQPRSQRAAPSRWSYSVRKRARSHSEQNEVKESLKLWARVVVSKLATKGRPLL